MQLYLGQFLVKTDVSERWAATFFGDNHRERYMTILPASICNQEQLQRYLACIKKSSRIEPRR
jgi:hypothetical protein